MSTTPRVLTLLSDPALREEIDRVTAAVGTTAVHLDAGSRPGGRIWAAARAVVVDGPAARALAVMPLTRRSAVFVVTAGAPDGPPPDTAVLSASIAVGAEAVLTLPAHADQLVRGLSDPGDHAGVRGSRGALVAVVGGRGGAGGSLFSAAMALSLTGSLLMDLDPWGGGIDLLLGAEGAAGLRWPDIQVQDGKLDWAAVREALPRQRGISILSGTRRAHDVEPAAAAAFTDAARSGGVTVVCDLPGVHTAAARTTVEAADLVVVVATCDVRSCAATAALAPALSALNPNVGLVVRGPAPGGLGSGEFASAVGLPLLTTMRPEPMLAERLEHGGLKLGGRSPLGRAAREILDVLADAHREPSGRAA